MAAMMFRTGYDPDEGHHASPLDNKEQLSTTCQTGSM